MNDTVWIIVIVLILILFKLGNNHRSGTNIKPPSTKPRPNVRPAPQPKYNR